jgi:hypothetical protein
VISFTSQPFYPRGNISMYQLNKRLAVSKFQLALFEKRKVACLCRESKYYSLGAENLLSEIFSYLAYH